MLRKLWYVSFTLLIVAVDNSQRVRHMIMSFVLYFGCVVPILYSLFTRLSGRSPRSDSVGPQVTSPADIYSIRHGTLSYLIYIHLRVDDFTANYSQISKVFGQRSDPAHACTITATGNSR